MSDLLLPAYSVDSSDEEVFIRPNNDQRSSSQFPTAYPSSSLILAGDLGLNNNSFGGMHHLPPSPSRHHPYYRTINDEPNGNTFFFSRDQSVTSSSSSSPASSHHQQQQQKKHTVYWQRWLMLFYVTLLNLLSDWTCYSVAPISVLSSDAFGHINPETLVTVFLIANSFSTSFEPYVLSRLGLGRTIVFGSFLLMMGCIVNALGMPILIQRALQKQQQQQQQQMEDNNNNNSAAESVTIVLIPAEYIIYLGFSIVGVSQPLYQCTPALLSASWFPEHERTMATGTALNSNQIGIGCAFVFGTLLVDSIEDVPRYFGILATMAAMVFLGCAAQFDDAPPTPPSETARILRGTMELSIPSMRDMQDFVTLQFRGLGRGGGRRRRQRNDQETKDESSSNSTTLSSTLYQRRSTNNTNADSDYTSSSQQQQQQHHHQNETESLFSNSQYIQLPATACAMDEGAEPILRQAGHRLDVDIRDDQIWLSARACLSRRGFVHALVAFAVSGIVINTLCTYMDYLVQLNDDDDGQDQNHSSRYDVGLVGGAFQIFMMISSMFVGRLTDTTRAYYTVVIVLLVLGAVVLAECGVSLDARRGGTLRWALLAAGAVVGPLAPVTTELAVDVAYPLSENTVLVIQQLFSNVLSAMFIPLFQAVKDVGSGNSDDAQQNNDNDDDAGGGAGGNRPQYTFSFYLLILLHACVTVFFATFNGTYLRYEAELERKKRDVNRQQKHQQQQQQQAVNWSVDSAPLLQESFVFLGRNNNNNNGTPKAWRSSNDGNNSDLMMLGQEQHPQKRPGDYFRDRRPLLDPNVLG